MTRLLLSGQNTPPPSRMGMGGWVGPKFQHFGPPGTGGGGGALFGGFGFVQGSEIGLNFSLFLHNMSNLLTLCCAEMRELDGSSDGCGCSA